MDQKTCFVISPIGSKDSEIRKNADDVFDLLIEPALERFGFRIVRADKISSVSSITAEVIQFVQSADLCVVDITGHNPNVMYEFGRRHETGRPYIMLAKNGEALPFDVNTIRTIFYDFSNQRDTRQTVKAIQSVVDKLLEEGLRPHSSGESLSSIADSLKRIERKIDDLVPSKGALPVTPSSSEDRVVQLLQELGPIGAFNFALTQRDVRLCEALIPRLEGLTDRVQFVLGAVAQTAAMGSREALARLEQEIVGSANWEPEQLQRLIGNYVEAVARFDMEVQAIERLKPLFENTRQLPPATQDPTPEHRAFLLNQYSKLLFGAGQHAKALEVGEEVVALRPQEPAYHLNFAITLAKAGVRDKALQYLETSITLAEQRSDLDSEHVGAAVQVFVELKNRPRAAKMLEKLRQLSPARATVLAETPAIKAFLRGDS